MTKQIYAPFPVVHAAVGPFGRPRANCRHRGLQDQPPVRRRGVTSSAGCTAASRGGFTDLDINRGYTVWTRVSLLSTTTRGAVDGHGRCQLRITRFDVVADEHAPARGLGLLRLLPRRLTEQGPGAARDAVSPAPGIDCCAPADPPGSGLLPLHPRTLDRAGRAPEQIRSCGGIGCVTLGLNHTRALHRPLPTDRQHWTRRTMSTT